MDHFSLTLKKGFNVDSFDAKLKMKNDGHVIFFLFKF